MLGALHTDTQRSFNLSSSEPHALNAGLTIPWVSKQTQKKTFPVWQKLCREGTIKKDLNGQFTQSSWLKCLLLFFFFFAVTSSAMSRPFKCNYSQLDSAKNYSTKNLLVLGGVLKRVELHCRYMLLYKFITSESCCKMYALFLLNKEKAFLSLTLVNLAQKNCADKKWISNFTRVSASGWSWMVISVDFRKDANLFGHLCDILKAIWELHFLVFLI